MDIISAYREVGSYRGAAAITGTTPQTVRRVIARHESGGAAPARVPRGRNYDAVADLVAERVERSKGRISAKRLLPAARAAGYEGSARNFRRLVSTRKALWRTGHHRGRRPAVWSRESIWSSTGGCWAGCTCSGRCWPGAGSGSCAWPMMSAPTRRWRCSRSASTPWAGSPAWCAPTGTARPDAAVGLRGHHRHRGARPLGGSGRLRGRDALILVFVGFFLATGLEPAIQALGRRGVRRGLAVIVQRTRRVSGSPDVGVLRQHRRVPRRDAAARERGQQHRRPPHHRPGRCARPGARPAPPWQPG